MKINLTKEVNKNTLLSMIVLNGMRTATLEALAFERNRRGKDEDIEADIKLTINGDEVDVQSFVKHWESQVNALICEEAKRIVQEKFNFFELQEKLQDLERRVDIEIKDRLEEWEKEQ